MASTPRWKVYDGSRYVAATKEPEAAAALVAAGFGDTVKLDHRTVVLQADEQGIAAESYDEATQIMYARAPGY